MLLDLLTYSLSFPAKIIFGKRGLFFKRLLNEHNVAILVLKWLLKSSLLLFQLCCHGFLVCFLLSVWICSVFFGLFSL